jgi:tetratricopeptide (TPR) repeat protein
VSVLWFAAVIERRCSLGASIKIIGAGLPLSEGPPHFRQKSFCDPASVGLLCLLSFRQESVSSEGKEELKMGNVISARRLLLFLCIAATACTHSPSSREARFLEKGHALAKQGDYARAVLEFKNASQAMPKDAEPYYQLAVMYLTEKDTRSAFVAVSRASELNPKHTAAALLLAKFKMASPDPAILKEAETLASNVLSITPDDTDAVNTLAMIEVRLGKTDDAMRRLLSTQARFPQDLRTASSIALLKLSEHDPAAAEAALKSVVDKSPTSAEALLSLAMFYVKAHRRDDAEALANRALGLDPQNITALTLLADIQTQSGRIDQADTTYRQIAALPDKSLSTIHAAFELRAGKRESGTAELLRIMKQDPDNRQARQLLVSADAAAGKAKEAENLLNDALKRNPKDVSALLQRSTFLLNVSRIDEAEKDLQSVLHSMPESAEAHHGLARVASLRGSSLTQRQELNEALRLDPNLLSARIELSNLLRAKDARGALELLDQTPKPQQSSPEFVIARNWTLFSLGKTAELRIALQQQPPEISRLSAIRLQIALLKGQEKDYSGERAELENILQQEPENINVLNLLAELSLAKDGMSKAITVVQDHAARKPDSALLLTQLGLWRTRAKQAPEARLAFSKAVTANPNYLPPIIGLADLDLEEGNVPAARSKLQEVLSKQPGNNLARIRLGQLEENAGNNNAAREHYRTVLQSEPANVVALNNLAYNLSTDNPDEALKYAQTAVELAPDAPFAQDTLGWIYYRKGMYDNAIRCFDRALQKETAAVYKYHLALAYSKTGNNNLAQQNLAAALKLDPKLPLPESITK